MRRAELVAAFGERAEGERTGSVSQYGRIRLAVLRRQIMQLDDRVLDGLMSGCVEDCAGDLGGLVLGEERGYEKQGNCGTRNI